ncbi:ATP-dependent DNA helicase RecG [bacterium]|nr:ATP-dependent DNA helicase RecG [bacterium]
MAIALDSPVTELKGVGEALAKKLAILGIKTVYDLIDYYPRRYEDYSNLTTINSLKPGPVSIQAKINHAKGRYVRRGMHITEAIASDNTGSIKLVWFNQPYRSASLKASQEYYLSGNFELRNQRFSITNPSIEMVSDMPVNTARIIPVYKETKGLSSYQIRGALKQCIDLIKKLPEILPPTITKKAKLMTHAEAILNLHFPKSSDDLAIARHRLAYEEVFSLSLASLLNKQEIKSEKSLSIDFLQQLAKDFVDKLPFQLTAGQRKIIWQIYLDLQKTQPMNRLVEGDVGSGKTVVATMAALMPLAQDWQVALMAPTEILARQHAETIHNLLKPLGMHQSVGLLVGSLKKSQKEAAHEAIKNAEIKFIIGTHALIQEAVDMHKLALIVIDEQHRFGVKQRKQLMSKAGHMPHVLSLTATPIPRSLALTLYGEMDVSILDEKPKNRAVIETTIKSPNSRPALYDEIDQEIDKGRQAFVVCPLISESEALNAKSAEETFQEMKKGYFKNRRIGLLHGKLKAELKQAIMQDFIDHKFDILVSTTVIEVGVDVPNATVMLIESAERFGLAQIHQLRGRVGRSEHPGYCYLMLSDSKPPSRRIRALESSNDGFKLAELDLDIRGPGAIYGTMQHGQLDLRIASLTDSKLIAEARNNAQELIDSGENLLQYKELMKTVNKLRAVTNLN